MNFAFKTHNTITTRLRVHVYTRPWSTTYIHLQQVVAPTELHVRLTLQVSATRITIPEMASSC